MFYCEVTMAMTLLVKGILQLHFTLMLSTADQDIFMWPVTARQLCMEAQGWCNSIGVTEGRGKKGLGWDKLGSGVGSSLLLCWPTSCCPYMNGFLSFYDLVRYTIGQQWTHCELGGWEYMLHHVSFSSVNPQCACRLPSFGLEGECVKKFRTCAIRLCYVTLTSTCRKDRIWNDRQLQDC